jgi:hypothetical protein
MVQGNVFANKYWPTPEIWKNDYKNDAHRICKNRGNAIAGVHVEQLYTLCAGTGSLNNGERYLFTK